MKNYDASQFYNEDFKIEYLEQFKPTEDNPDNKSQTTIAYKFYHAKEYEEKHNKDLCEFTDDQLKEVFFAMEPMNSNVSRANGRFISVYISWGMAKKGLKGKIHPLLGKSATWYDQFVTQSKKLYFSDADLYSYDKELVNPQDIIVLCLPFVGVAGHDLSEMRNLRKSDVDFENGILTLNDDRYGERKLTIPDDMKEYILRTIKQALTYPQEYLNRNGTSEGRSATSELVENDYVIKTVARRSKTDGRTDKHTIYRRMDTINEFLGLPYLTVKNIQKSGMIKMAKDIYLRDGVLDKEQLAEIGDMYGLRKVMIRDYEFYNTTAMRTFINEENIRKLYDLEIN